VRALALFADLGSLDGQAYALNDLGAVQQQTGDYPAAAASHRQALALFRETGNRLGQAEALNRLGELSSRTSATGQAREHHAKARAIARDLRAPLEEARSLEGTGRACLQDGNNDEGLDCLRRALTIYQRIGAPGAQRVKETLRNPSLAENAEHLLCPAVAARARCSIAAPNGGYGSSTGGRPRSQGATPGAGAGLALR